MEEGPSGLPLMGGRGLRRGSKGWDRRVGGWGGGHRAWEERLWEKQV